MKIALIAAAIAGLPAPLTPYASSASAELTGAISSP